MTEQAIGTIRKHVDTQGVVVAYAIRVENGWHIQWLFGDCVNNHCSNLEVDKFWTIVHDPLNPS